jgi:hypothetical protein
LIKYLFKKKDFGDDRFIIIILVGPHPITIGLMPACWFGLTLAAGKQTGPTDEEKVTGIFILIRAISLT